MSSRGRGYGGRGSFGGRGGYRGNTYRGSNPRGSYEGRGRGGYNSHYNNDRSYNSNMNDRYNPGRDRDDSYKKPYRPDSSSYSSRDYMSRGGSPDRKRMRIEGPGDRRSHEGSSHYGSSYGGRQESYGERRSFGDERRRSPSREGYRKMAPPRSPTRMSAPRSRVMRAAPHRSIRGRTLRTRGSFRGTMRSRGYYPRRMGERSDYGRPFRPKIMRSPMKMKRESPSSTEAEIEDWDTDEKEGADEGKDVGAKTIKSESGEARKGEAEADKPEDAVSDDDLPRSRITGRKFIALYCMHCKEKRITFGGYEKHLMGKKHQLAMGMVARRHKAQLLRMRLAQRNAQREMEEAETEDITAETTFCMICKLNHRTTRLAHNKTEAHQAMKRFLMPNCRVCRLTFRSPMIYEHHICSLDHIKRKARQAPEPSSPKPLSDDDGRKVDLDNFMTLDSVGDVDEVDDDDDDEDEVVDDEKKIEDEEAKPVVAKKPKKKEINIGSEHIKKVQVFWCELCRIYLRRTENAADEADALRRHCRLRAHLGQYVRHRDHLTLRKQAERIHRQLHQQKEEAKEDANASKEDAGAEEVKKPTENGNAGGEVAGGTGGDDKLWADVDKDIGDLLREVDPSGANEASDDEEDLGRYDKFRKSVKEGDEEQEVCADEVAAEPEPAAV